MEEKCLIEAWDLLELQKLHTKQLLKLRRGDSSQLLWSGTSGNCTELCPYGDECFAMVESNRQKVLSILATREHVPNKQESKALRKARKKKGI